MKDEEYMGSFLEWLGFDRESKRMFDDETNMSTHHPRQLRSTAIPLFQHAANEYPGLLIGARTQTTAVVYVMLWVIVRFDNWLGNISYFARGQGERTADTGGVKRKWVHTKWESLCFSLGSWFSFGFMVFLFGLHLWFSLWSTFVSFLWVYVILIFFRVCVNGFTEDER